MTNLLVKNLRVLKTSKNLSINDLAQVVSVSDAVMKNYMAGRTPIPITHTMALAEHLGVNVDWLLTGEGEFGGPNVSLSGRGQGKHLIPYIDIDVTGSGIEVFNHDFKPTFYMDLPGFRDCNFSINVFGNAMHPTFDSGTIILCKELTDKGQIIYGEVYFIVTEENRLLRRVLKSGHRGHIITHCDNPEGEGTHKGRRYADLELVTSNIIKIYLVKGSIRRHQI